MKDNKKKQFTEDGFAVWVIVGERKGWHRSDFRRVYVSEDNIQFIKLNGSWVRLEDTGFHRVYAIGADGEVRDF